MKKPDPSPVEDIVKIASELAVDSRKVYLNQACSGDAALRDEVEHRLAALQSAVSCPDQDLVSTEVDHDRATLTFEGVEGDTESSTVRDRLDELAEEVFSGHEQPGSTVGRYKLMQKIGEGGFGVVYMAEQSQPVRRRVALKIIKAGMDTRQVIARFEAERQALALMEHPNIAKVLDAGATDQGRPYFVMELVNGVSITNYCDEAKLDMKERLDLFKDVCSAIQHAHLKGIIHRDIKPSNVLVTLHSGKPLVKVIDFGIARATNQKLTDKTLFTNFGQMIGTPTYMSPEQAVMSGLDVDTRTDVYSLGVLLYQLLTGATPLDEKTLRKAGFDEIRRMIREQEPPKPSTRLSTLADAVRLSVASSRQSNPQSLSKQLRGDLDWIVMKALEKDRNRRYESASDFAQDIDRYLNAEPVEAAAPTTAYKLKKYVQRHRGPVAVVAVIVLLLVGGIIGTATQAVRANRQAILAVQEADRADEEAARAKQAEAEAIRRREDAERETALSKESIDFLIGMFEEADPANALGEDITVLEVVGRAVDGMERRFKDRPLIKAELQSSLGNVLAALGRPGQAETLLRAAVHSSSRVVGEEHLVTLRFKNRLGYILHQQGAFNEAEQLYRDALEGRRELLGDQAPDTFSSSNNLGLLLMDRGKYVEAETLLSDALAGRRSKFGGKHTDTLTSINNLAILLMELGRYDEAENLFREALAGRRDILPDNHPSTRLTLNNLASLLQRRGNYSEAESLFREALLSAQEVLQENHPNILTSKNNLALLLKARGKYEEAETLYREVLEQRRDRLGELDPQTLNSFNNLGMLLLASGNYISAEPLLRKAYEGRRIKLGIDHPSVLESINNLAYLLLKRNELDAAEQLFREAAADMGVLLGEDNPKTLTLIDNHAGVLKTLGEFDKAEALYIKAMDGRRRRLGEDHADVYTSISNLGALYFARGDFVKAEKYCHDAMLGLKRVLGEDNPTTIKSIENFGRVLLSRGEYYKAEQQFKEALERYRRLLGDKHLVTLNSVNNIVQLADQLVLQDNPKTAEPLYQEALERYRVGLKQRHRITQSVAERYANCLDILGRPEEAKALRLEFEVRPPASPSDGQSSSDEEL